MEEYIEQLKRDNGFLKEQVEAYKETAEYWKDLYKRQVKITAMFINDDDCFND